MEIAVITAVGIDVSKSKSTVAVRRPGGEIALRPFEVHHTNSDLKKLASTLKKLGGDIRIVMEHTSTYWRPIALTLKEAGFFVSVVNAMLIHDFSDNTIRKLKTDRADALKIANYALTFWDTLPPFNNEEETRLWCIVGNCLTLFPTFLRSSENTMSGVRSKNPISRRQLVPHL